MTTGVQPALSFMSPSMKDEAWLSLIDPSDKNLFERLMSLARDNDGESIDCLFTLACDKSEIGSKAESFLFDLYTGTEGTNIELREQLGKDSLKLHEIIKNRNFKKLSENNLTIENKWIIPSKILIMAAFTAESNSEQLNIIVDDLKNKDVENNFIFIEEGGMNSFFFNKNRMITSAELDNFSKKLNFGKNNLRFIEASKIGNEIGNEIGKDIDKLLISSMKNFDEQYKLKENSVFYIPLLIRDHWILFGISEDKSGNKSAVVFDSMNFINKKDKKYLTEIFKYYGGDKLSISFIEKNIQKKYKLNDCGVLVFEAMERLSKHADVQAEDVLKELSEEIAKLDATERILFNRQKRAKILGEMIDCFH